MGTKKRYIVATKSGSSEPLTAEFARSILDYDPATGVFKWKVKVGRGRHVRTRGDIAGCLLKSGYRQIGIAGATYEEHRLAWLYVYGIIPGNHIDHINGMRSDNRIDNLREATISENLQNRVKLDSRNTSGETGVSLNRRVGKWVATVTVNGRCHSLGYFEKIEDAVIAARAGRLKYHPRTSVKPEDLVVKYRIGAYPVLAIEVKEEV